MARRITPNISIAAVEHVAKRYARNKSESDRRSHGSLLRRFAAHAGDIHVGSVRAEHVEAFFYGDGGLHETVKTTTLANYRVMLKSFLRYCDRRDWLERSVEQITEGLVEKSTQSNRNRYRMTRAELRRLLDAADFPRDRALTAFVANTGLRISEAQHMRVRDVSFGKEELYVYLVKTKEEVTVPLSLDLETELRSWLTTYTEAVGKLSRGFYLFPACHKPLFMAGHAQTPSRDRVLNPGAILSHPQTIIKDLAERAEIELEDGDAWHTVRRSFARILYDDARDQGHDNALRIVQAALNHKSVVTTEKYLGLNIERQRYSDMIKGKPFLTADIDTAKVVSLGDRRTGNG